MEIRRPTPAGQHEPDHGHLMVFQAGVAAEREDWLKMWESMETREVFAHPAYVELFTAPNERGICFAMRTAAGHVMLPLVVRQISAEPWAGWSGSEIDLVSPYGYGGPYRSRATPADLMNFWSHVDEWARTNDAVSLFVRFCLDQDAAAGFSGQVIHRSENVIRRLDVQMEDLWRDYSAKVRKNVRRAKSLGLRVETDSVGERLSDFLEVYYSTLRRRDAADIYYFDESYFRRLHDGLRGHFVYFFVLDGDRVVSTELVLISGTNAYSFLGGTTQLGMEKRANDLLKHAACEWLQGAGRSAFVLGGGITRDDGIYRYKLAFSPSGATPFRVGQAVYDEAIYGKLVARRTDSMRSQGLGWEPRPDFFPAYRS